VETIHPQNTSSRRWCGYVLRGYNQDFGAA
jgi:hypothetical protein